MSCSCGRATAGACITVRVNSEVFWPLVLITLWIRSCSPLFKVSTKHDDTFLIVSHLGNWALRFELSLDLQRFGLLEFLWHLWRFKAGVTPLAWQLVEDVRDVALTRWKFLRCQSFEWWLLISDSFIESLSLIWEIRGVLMRNQNFVLLFSGFGSPCAPNWLLSALYCLKGPIHILMIGFWLRVFVGSSFWIGSCPCFDFKRGCRYGDDYVFSTISTRLDK